MKDEIALEITPEGMVRGPYSDEDTRELAQMIDGELVTVCRASNVEWEKVVEADGEVHEGWTVRAAHDPELAIRYVSPEEADRRLQENPGVPIRDLVLDVSKEGRLKTFESREHAIEIEVKNFFKLLPRTSNEQGR